MISDADQIPVDCQSIGRESSRIWDPATHGRMFGCVMQSVFASQEIRAVRRGDRLVPAADDGFRLLRLRSDRRSNRTATFVRVSYPVQSGIVDI